MSGRKSQLVPFQAITNGDMSGNITGPTTNIQYLDNIGVQFDFTGTPTGNFFVDVSLDQVNWTPIQFSSAPVASGSAGNVYLDINQLSAPWIRLRYVASSSVGTLQAFITAKQV